jgi:hypothetical protein
MIEFLVSLVANNVIYPLIVPGLMAGVISILFSFFIPNAVAQYKMAFLLGGIVLVLFFTFYAGKYTEESKHAITISQQKADIAHWKAKSGEITYQTVIKYVDRINTIEKVKTEYVTVYVDRWLTKEIDTKFPLPRAFIRVHDAAIEGNLSGTPLETDGNASEITISRAAKTIGSNYLTCKATEEQLLALQSWIRQQQELTN